LGVRGLGGNDLRVGGGGGGGGSSSSGLRDEGVEVLPEIAAVCAK